MARAHGDEPLEVRGALPRELRGTLFQAGPAGYSAGRERVQHVFDGDGAAVAVRFDGHRAFAALRFVETDERAREQKAGKGLFGGYGTRLRSPVREIFLRRSKNPANTGVLLWQDRIFALCEAGLPVEMSETLDTLGPRSFGVVAPALSAHPKRIVRPITICTGLSPGKRATLDVYALPDRGDARRLATLDVPDTFMLHDFALAERHIVFVLAPLRLRPLALFTRGPGLIGALSMREGAAATVVVVPLDAPEAAFRAPIDACYVEHLTYTFERGDELVLDVTRYDSLAWLQGNVAGMIDGRVGRLESQLSRLRIDLRGERAKIEEGPRGVGLPQIHPARAGQGHRFVYTVGWAAPEQNGKQMWNAIVRHDRDRGETARYAPGSDCVVSEAQIVPRGAGEEEGWLLTVVHDLGEARSRVEILDLADLTAGPIASGRARELWPFRIHGAFRPAA